MFFLSHTEAYLYSIYILNQIVKKHSSNEAIVSDVNSSISFIKQSVENHELDEDRVIINLKNLRNKVSGKISSTDDLILKSTIDSLLNIQLNTPIQKKWENPLRRRFESQIQIEFLLNPTDMMMESVKKVSDQILTLLKDEPNIQEHFFYMLSTEAHAIGFGSFKEKPNFQIVEKILTQNNKSDLPDILHMHFKFARDGIYKLSDKYKKLKQENLFYDDKIFGSEYYTDRGRSGTLNHIYTNRMGIMHSFSDSYNEGLPKHKSWWISDSKCQAPDFGSAYLSSLIYNDIPYVAGPSGMTSRFISHLLAYGTHDKNEAALYLFAVSAYMVSGGFHSLHEVIGPIAHCLPEKNLIPGYNANARMNSTPNFSVFYNTMEEIDPTINPIKNNGWDKLMQFFENYHLKSSLNLMSYHVLNGDFNFNDKTISQDNYKIIFNKAKTKLQKLTFLYELLLSDREEILSSEIIRNLNFLSKDITEAINYIENLIKVTLNDEMSDNNNSQEQYQQNSNELFDEIIPQISKLYLLDNNTVINNNILDNMLDSISSLTFKNSRGLSL